MEAEGPISVTELKKQQHNYSQIEKEAMSIVFAVKKFAVSLRCWQITSPSIMIFDPQTGVPLLPVTRL